MKSLIENLPYKYPLQDQTKDFLALKNIDKYFNDTFIILDTKLKELIKDFILFKRKYGSEDEKKLFNKFVEEKKIIYSSYVRRLYECRPVVFYGHNDMTMDRKGQKSYKQIGRYSTDEYLGYDEIEIAALLSVSIPTPFVNDGSRDNRYTKTKTNKFQKEGILVGQVGSRFEVENKMEWRTMVITERQNTVENGYGHDYDYEHNEKGTSKYLYNQIWTKFYGVPYLYSFEQAKKETKLPGNRLVKIGSYYFDTMVYRNRTKYLANQFLKEANRRGSKCGAYCYVVGLGLGAWLFCSEQKNITIDCYLELLKENNYSSIKELYFGYMQPSFNSKLNKIKNTKICYGTRNPSEYVCDTSDGVLVCNWAFDGNSYIGNEYFIGNLNTSGDPAAACSSYIAYIGNPELNKNIKLLLL